MVGITCLLMANWKDAKWYDKYAKKETPIKRGSFISSTKEIAKKAKVSRQVVRTALKNLKNIDFLTIQSTPSYTAITICNYSTYQDDNSEANQPPNKRLTNDQPTTNQRLTTIEEYKESKERKEDLGLLPQTGEETDVGIGKMALDDSLDDFSEKPKQNAKALFNEFSTAFSQCFPDAPIPPQWYNDKGRPGVNARRWNEFLHDVGFDVAKTIINNACTKWKDYQRGVKNFPAIDYPTVDIIKGWQHTLLKPPPEPKHDSADRAPEFDRSQLSIPGEEND